MPCSHPAVRLLATRGLALTQVRWVEMVGRWPSLSEDFSDSERQLSKTALSLFTNRLSMKCVKAIYHSLSFPLVCQSSPLVPTPDAQEHRETAAHIHAKQ